MKRKKVKEGHWFPNNLEKELQRLKKASHHKHHKRLVELVVILASENDRIYVFEWKEVESLKALEDMIQVKARNYIIQNLARHIDDVMERRYYEKLMEKYKKKFVLLPTIAQLIRNGRNISFILDITKFIQHSTNDEIFNIFKGTFGSSEDRDQLWKDVRTEWIRRAGDFESVARELGSLMWPHSLYSIFFKRFSNDGYMKQVLGVLDKVHFSHFEIMEIILKSKDMENFLKEAKKMGALRSFIALMTRIGCPEEDRQSYCSILKGGFACYPTEIVNVIELVEETIVKVNPEQIKKNRTIEKICEILLRVKEDSIEFIKKLFNKENKPNVESVYDAVLVGMHGKLEKDAKRNSSLTSFASSCEANALEAKAKEIKGNVYFTFPHQEYANRHDALHQIYEGSKRSREEDINVIDIITYSDENAHALANHPKYPFSNSFLLSSKDTDANNEFLTSSDVQVRIGTLAQLVEYESRHVNSGRKKRLLLLDDADHYIFDKPIVRQTNSFTTMGTYALIPVLQYVLNQVKEKLSFSMNKGMNFTDKELKQYLKSTFYPLKLDLTDFKHRFKSFYSDKVLSIVKNISYNYSEETVHDVFDSSKVLYSRNVPRTETENSLRDNKMPLGTSILFGKAFPNKTNNREVWLYFKTKKDLQDFRNSNSDGDITWKRPHIEDEETRSPICWENLSDNSYDEVLKRARKIMNDLDQRRTGHFSPLDKELKNRKYLSTLDEIIFYLRYVHLYCFYRQKQYLDLSDMIKNGFYPVLRRQQITNLASEEEESYKCPQGNYQNSGGYTSSKSISPGFSDIIRPLPSAFKEYCIKQLDKWVETCYYVVKMSESQEYTSNLKDKIQKQSDAHRHGLVDVLSPYYDDQDNEFRQIFEIQNSLTLTPINFANKYTHIKDIIEGYRNVHYFSEVSLTERRVNIMKTTYGFNVSSSSVEIPKSLKFCCHSNSYIRNHYKWLDAVCKSVACQIRLSKNVFVFCESDYLIYSQILPKLHENINELKCCIVTKESQLERVPPFPKVIIATPSAARSINYDFTDHDRILGNHVCMTFIPSSNVDHEYCKQKRVVGAKQLSNTFQYIIYDEGNEIEDDFVPDPDDDNYCQLAERRIKSWYLVNDLKEQMETLCCKIKGKEGSLKNYEYGTVHQAHALWMTHTLEKVYTGDEYNIDEHLHYIKNFDVNLVFLGKLMKPIIDRQFDVENDEEASYSSNVLEQILSEYMKSNEEPNMINAFAIYYYGAYQVRKARYSKAIITLKCAKKLFERHILPIYNNLLTGSASGAKAKKMEDASDTTAKQIYNIIYSVITRIDLIIKTIMQPTTENGKQSLGLKTLGMNLEQSLVTVNHQLKSSVKSHCISLGFFGYFQLISANGGVKPPIDDDLEKNEVSDIPSERSIAKRKSYHTDIYDKRKSRVLRSMFPSGVFNWTERGSTVDSDETNQYDIMLDESNLEFEAVQLIRISKKKSLASNLTRRLSRKSGKSFHSNKRRSNYKTSPNLAKTTKKTEFFKSFPFLDEHEDIWNSFTYRVKKLAAWKSSGFHFSRFQKKTNMNDLKLIATTFKVVICYADKFYLPSTSDIVSVVNLERDHETNEWRIDQVKSTSLYDLFFSAYDCYELAKIYSSD